MFPLAGTGANIRIVNKSKSKEEKLVFRVKNLHVNLVRKYLNNTGRKNKIHKPKYILT
jgi:hypothetical protein